MGLQQRVDLPTVLHRVVSQTQQCANLAQRHVERTAMTDELQALNGVRLENGNYPTLRLFFVQFGIDCA
ncbi:hypothetical protein HA39_22810 [Pantoea brenneri]|nr:hypothetical protein HA39_22810 [Pantoea brenneri]